MTADKEYLISQVLNDTGMFARYGYGFNYDIDDSGGAARKTKINIGTGGIRREGAHRLMTDFLDSESRHKHLEMPRETFKTCGAASLATRLCLSNPGFPVLWAMQTFDFAKEKANEVIKAPWEDADSPVRRLFGDRRGYPWTDDRLTFDNGSFIKIAGVNTSRTGGHYQLQIADDLVDEQNIATPEGMGKVQRYFESLQPMLMGGGTQLIIGTRWHQADLYGYILANLAEDFDILILDAGFEPVQREDGTWDLEGTATFPHLSKERLLTKLRLMQYEKFCSQYLNKIVTGQRPSFRREHFQPVRWSEWMRGLTCYLISDTAFAINERACHSVVGLIGLSSDDKAYLLDLQVGHMDTPQFLDAFFGTLKKWETRVPINAQHLEQIALNVTLRHAIVTRAKMEGIRLNLIESPRGVNDLRKNQRIQALTPRFQEKRFFVVDTVPKYFRDSSGQHVLFDPEGAKNEAGHPVPAGELVNQAIHFPVANRKDIMDAIADIDRMLPDGTRVCAYSPSASRRFARTLDRAREPSRRVTFDAPAIGESWYEKTARDLNL